MNCINAVLTPRDEISQHGYMKPLVQEVLRGGAIVQAVEGKTPRTKQEKREDFWGKYGRFGDVMLDKREKLDAMTLEDRREAREKAYKTFVKIIGFILFLFYLPLKPWIWIAKRSFSNFQKLYSGMIVPL